MEREYPTAGELRLAQAELLVLGHERAPHEPVPLFKRRNGKTEGGDAG